MEMGQAFQFKTPSSILVGSVGMRKDSFHAILIGRTRGGIVRSLTMVVVYCYGAWQDNFQDMKKSGVAFHEGVPEADQLRKWFPEGGLLVLDDLMWEGGNDRDVLDLFTKHSHHRDITVMYLCQDMFPPGKYAKSISRNAHYIVPFKNPRDQLGMRNLLLQAYPSNWQDVMEAYRHPAPVRLPGTGFTSRQRRQNTHSQSPIKRRRLHAM